MLLNFILHLIPTAAHLITVKADLSKPSLNKKNCCMALKIHFKKGLRRSNGKKVWSESNDLNLSASTYLFLISLFYASIFSLALWGPIHYFADLTEVCKGSLR